MGRISQRSKKQAEKEFNVYFKSMEREYIKKGDRLKTPYGFGTAREDALIGLCSVIVDLDNAYIDEIGEIWYTYMFSINKVEKINLPN